MVERLSKGFEKSVALALKHKAYLVVKNLSEDKAAKEIDNSIKTLSYSQFLYGRYDSKRARFVFTDPIHFLNWLVGNGTVYSLDKDRN